MRCENPEDQTLAQEDGKVTQEDGKVAQTINEVHYLLQTLADLKNASPTVDDLEKLMHMLMQECREFLYH